MTTEQPSAGARQASGPTPDDVHAPTDSSGSAGEGSGSARENSPGAGKSELGPGRADASGTGASDESGVERQRPRRWGGLRRSRAERSPAPSATGRALRPAVPPHSAAKDTSQPGPTVSKVSEVERAAIFLNASGSDSPEESSAESPKPARSTRASRRASTEAFAAPLATTSPDLLGGKQLGDAENQSGKQLTDAGDQAGNPAGDQGRNPNQAPTPGGSGRFRRNKKAALPTSRPPGAPPDPWTAFAAAPVEREPGRVRSLLRRVGRALRHEYALVIYGSLLLAVALTWPALRYPLHTVPQDVWDPARQAWQVAWAGHVLLTEPARLWQANAFFPEHYSFAFGDALLGYAPAGMLGEGPLAAVLRYNILFVLAHALLAVGGYALVRQLGAGRTGAVVGAVAFAYAPWRLAQEGHLDIVSAGGIPLALAMLARGHGYSLRYGYRPGRRRTGWAVAGWLVATWQISLGFSLGLPFAYVLGTLILTVGVAVLVRRLRRRKQGAVLGWRLLVTDLLGSLIFVGVGALIALPYFRLPVTGPAGEEIKFFSSPVRSLLIGPAESRMWGAPHAVARASLEWPSEMSLLPGFVLYALALTGLMFSVWRLWQRLVLLIAAVVSAIFALGTTFFEGRWTYLPLFGHLPASFGVRIPGRLMLWVTLILAILAAGAVAEFVRRAEGLAAARTQPWPGPWLRLATFVPLLLLLVEGWNATAHPVVADQPAAMRTVQGPMLVLPTTALTDQTIMLWSTSDFQQIANGSGGFAPQRQSELRRSVASFPDPASIQYLRSIGVGTVLLLRSEVTGTPWERSGDIPVDSLNITRQDLDENSVLFRLG